MKKGFTLIELLVVISIIAVLSTIGLVVYGGVGQKARDSIRKSDLRTFATALEIYFQQNGKYIGAPQQDGSCSNTDNFYSDIQPQINGIPPKDPQTHQSYLYTADNKCQSFRLCAKLENPSDPDLNTSCPSDYNYSIIPN